MTKENRRKKIEKNVIIDEFRGPFKKGKKGPKGPKVAILVIETYFLASRLNVTKENRKKILFLKNVIIDEFRGPLKKGKNVPKGPKVTILGIETYCLVCRLIVKKKIEKQINV